RGQGELDQDAVHVTSAAERVHQGEQLRLLRARREPVAEGAHAHLLACLLLVADVEARGGIVADQHGGETRYNPAGRETRDALPPSGVGALVAHGHTVVVEHGAGDGSSLPDRHYRDAGATLADAATVWGRAELVLKVKEPLPSEYDLLRPDQILFAYLH